MKKAHQKNKQCKQNLVRKIEVGQTLESNDLNLPHDKNNPPKSKKRPVITAFINRDNELAVIPASTQKTKNTTYYGRYGIKFYRNVIEIEDNEGKPIKVGEKYRVTDKCTKLPIQETKFITNQVINHTRNSSENRRKLEEYKNRHKKKKD